MGRTDLQGSTAGCQLLPNSGPGQPLQNKGFQTGSWDPGAAGNRDVSL